MNKFYLTAKIINKVIDMKLISKISNESGWLWGILWFFIVLYGSGSIANLIGNNLPDEYMGEAVEIGIILFIIGAAISIVINKYRKRFLLGFMLAFLAAIFFTAISIIANTR